MILILLTFVSLHPAFAESTNTNLSMLQEMAANVSAYHANLIQSISNKASFNLPPAFESLLKSSSSNLSPTLSRLVVSLQNLNHNKTSPQVNRSDNILNNETLLLDPAEAAIAAASLAVSNQATGLASAISYTVSSGLGTLATTISVVLAEIGTITGPTSLLLSETLFAQTLYNDMSDNSDIITAAINKIISQMQSFDLGGAQGTIKGYLNQLESASSLLSSATKRFNNI